MNKLFRYLNPYKREIVIVLVLVFLQSLAELYLPTLMSHIVDTGIVKGDIDYILRIGILMLGVTGVGTVCSILASLLSAKTAAGFGKILRANVFERVESFSLNEFNHLGTATLITRTTNDINQIQTVTFMIMRMMISAPFMCLGGIIMAVSKDKPLSLVIVGAIPIIAAVIVFIISKAIPLFKTMQIKIDKLNLVLREGLTGVRVIRAFNRIDREAQRFTEANTDLMENAVRVNKLIATMMPAMMLIMNFTLIAIIWFGSIRIDNGSMQVVALMAFIQYAMMIMISLLIVSMMFIMVPRASASAIRINEVLETIPGITDPGEFKEPDNPRGLLEFKGVTFSFPGAEQPAINRVSFKASPGEITAIIGGTGSGKSALINLIPRFYDVDQGNVLIDGVDVREMSQERLRAKIGLVPQKTVLFTGTIADNIRYGKDNASEGEVHHAAEVAQAIEFVDSMPDGFNSIIEQGGTNVSGGQK
ncbi:MAG: ABC transporter ATP-binding protein, partial [Chitinophagales bacterium]